MNESPAPSGSARFPTFARFGRWLLDPLWRLVAWRKLWRVVGRICVGLAVLATLIALVGVEEHLRGKWAWSRYKHRLEAQGEKLDMRAYIPPPVPDDQNFTMTPFLAPLYDYGPGAPGQGLKWRDTNGLALAYSLGYGRMDAEPDTGKRGLIGPSQRMTDLRAWAVSLATNTSPASSITAEAAEAFRRRYGAEPPPEMQSPRPYASEGEAAEAFRRRYGLEPPAQGLPQPPVSVPAASEVQAPPAAALVRTRPEAATEVLRLVAPYNPVLEELRRASQRPYARFNIHYQDDFAPAICLPHLALLRRTSRIFQLRASAELALGHTEAALADAKMALYLAETLKAEPFLICQLVRVAMAQLALRPIWEGLAEHKWSDAQLVQIGQRLDEINLLFDAALRGERAFAILTLDQMRHLGMLDPDNYSGRVNSLLNFELGGFYYQNQLFVARMFQQHFVPVVDAANQRLHPSRGFASDMELTNSVAGGFAPYRVGARLLLHGLVGAQAKFGFGQTRVNEAIVACALERYRLAQGRYPESLEALSPRFLQKVPHDLITGGTLKYRRTPDNQYLLYSVGWNEKDDGGQVVPPKTGEPGSDLTQGDWVWQYPTSVEKSTAQ